MRAARRPRCVVRDASRPLWQGRGGAERGAAHSSLSAAISPWIRSSFFARLHVSVYDFQASRQVERSRSFHVRRIRFAIFSLVASWWRWWRW